MIIAVFFFRLINGMILRHNSQFDIPVGKLTSQFTVASKGLSFPLSKTEAKHIMKSTKLHTNRQSD